MTAIKRTRKLITIMTSIKHSVSTSCVIAANKGELSKDFTTGELTINTLNMVLVFQYKVLPFLNVPLQFRHGFLNKLYFVFYHFT